MVVALPARFSFGSPRNFHPSRPTVAFLSRVPGQSLHSLQQRFPHVRFPFQAQTSPVVRCHATLPSPGLSEDLHFPPTDYIRFWRSYDNSPRLAPFLNSASHLRFVAQSAAQSPSTLSYWLFTAPRMAYFSNIAFIGYSTASRTVFNSPRLSDPFVKLARNVDEVLYTFRQDSESVRDGVYRLPWDMTLLHRQHNPFFVLQQTAHLLREVLSMSSRLREQTPDFSVWLDSPFLPQYYKQSYHIQTDGWLSSASANVYEVSTEALFLGRQDAMQRSTLIPIQEYVSKCNKAQNELNIVELAAGTGRFATFVRDNWPQAQYTITDLSPFYLEKARENMRYWRSKRVDRDAELGHVRFLQAAAEDLPIDSESADVVYCIYLFHELPPDVRRAVVKEVHRVLKPGGMFVLTDSIQRGDQLSVDDQLAIFSRLNEPWYKSYITEDLVDLVQAEGRFKPSKKEVRSKTKMLSFIKAT